MTRPPRSLFDDVDLAAVRAAAAARTGDTSVVVSCLVEGGVLAWAPDDPEWPDRDRVVVSSPRLAASFAGIAGLGRPDVVDGGRALAAAAGAAAVGALEGGVFRVFCLLDEAAIEDGSLWEAARSARSGTLVAVVLAPAGPARLAGRLLSAAGWCVAEAAADEPAEVLGGLDRVHRENGSVPGVVLAVTP